jgi:hypothetical protein
MQLILKRKQVRSAKEYHLQINKIKGDTILKIILENK